MPRYGLIVEGPYDAPVFEMLIRRLNEPNADFYSILAEGHSGLKKLLPTFLSRLESAFAGSPPDRAFIVRDSDMKSPEQVVIELRDRIGNRRFNFEYEITIPVREMETWLLGDERAITTVASQRGGRPVPYLQGDLENIQQPKELLMERLNRARLAYTPAVCAAIAEVIDFDTLKYRCRSFREFAALFRF